MDINQFVEENRFRRHLLYELQSFDLHVPALRERSEDIPAPLSENIFETSSRDASLPPHSLQEMERDALIQAAIHCRGKASQMVTSLNIGRTSLWRKLKQFNIHLADYKVG